MTGPLAVIAGQGQLPQGVIDAARAEGRDVFVLAFDGITDPGLVRGLKHAWVRLGAIGAAFDALRASGAREVCMIGPVGRPSLSSLGLDWRGMRLAARVGLGGQSDKQVIGAIVGELEAEGFRVVGAEEVMGTLLMPEGPITGAGPDPEASADIRRGLEIAGALGGLDIGQAVVVQQGLVLGVEAIEGTDALLARCGELRREGPGGVLVKVRKPGQDRRVDLPTIGPTTLDQAVRAGLRGIALGAGEALIARRHEVVERADRAGLFIVGMPTG